MTPGPTPLAQVEGEEKVEVVFFQKFQMSNEKKDPGWLGYIGDEILPSYMGIII